MCSIDDSTEIGHKLCAAWPLTGSDHVTNIKRKLFAWKSKFNKVTSEKVNAMDWHDLSLSAIKIGAHATQIIGILFTNIQYLLFATFEGWHYQLVLFERHFWNFLKLKGKHGITLPLKDVNESPKVFESWSCHHLLIIRIWHTKGCGLFI